MATVIDACQESGHFQAPTRFWRRRCFHGTKVRSKLEAMRMASEEGSTAVEVEQRLGCRHHRDRSATPPDGSMNQARYRWHSYVLVDMKIADGTRA